MEKGLIVDPHFCSELMRLVNLEGVPSAIKKKGMGPYGPRAAVALESELASPTGKEVVSCPDVKVHSSVAHRWNVRSGYRPTNLLKHFGSFEITKDTAHIDVTDPKYAKLFAEPEIGADAYEAVVTASARRT